MNFLTYYSLGGGVPSTGSQTVLFLSLFYAPSYQEFGFWVKTFFRCKLIDGLTNEARKPKYDRPVQPSIKQELKTKFDRNRELADAWREFEDSLIEGKHPENKEVVYKTDEASLFFSEERLLDQHLNLRFWNSVPALLVGLGILGTFVGMVWGLIPFSDIDFTNTNQIREA